MLQRLGGYSSTAAILLLLLSPFKLLPASLAPLGFPLLGLALLLQGSAALFGASTGAFEVLLVGADGRRSVLHSKLATKEMPDLSVVLAALQKD